MVFRAREMGIEVRLARMEDPLPDGPWDLVIAVLAVHHLDADQKRDLLPARSRAVALAGARRPGGGRDARASRPSRASTSSTRPSSSPSGAAATSSGRATTSR